MSSLVDRPAEPTTCTAVLYCTVLKLQVPPPCVGLPLLLTRGLVSTERSFDYGLWMKEYSSVLDGSATSMVTKIPGYRKKQRAAATRARE